MKRLWVLMIFCLLPFGLFAQQQQTEYNRKGDEAMKRQDYRDAKMWYEEGVSQCDSYSIKQLTTIWVKSERMRPSMRSLMNKCLNCLTVKATENDLDAISHLILYYSKGIGTPKNEELVTYWTAYKKDLLNPKPVQTANESVNLGRRMEFFIGYSFSVEAPYGITIGGVAQHVGWYVRFKTNMSFMNYTNECNNKGEILDFTGNNESYVLSSGDSNKKNSYAGTAGLVVKCLPWLYTSVGVGYGERALLHSFTTHSHTDYDKTRTLWCQNIESSYKGVAAEADVMVKLGKTFYLTAGCNTINFKYIDLNAGLGVFF